MQLFDGVELHSLFESGYKNLKKNMDLVNGLNVFPVPDGDTGTNMVKTIGGALQPLAGDETSVGVYMKALAHGAFMSARGNSGVIFSQFIHGLYRGFADLETVSFGDFTKGFACATEDAFNSINNPTEGTILTVIREASEFLRDNGDKYDNYKDGFAALIARMKTSLANTPNLLAVLKEAGVVDSGGAGLVCFVEGMYAYICGEDIEDVPEFDDGTSVVTGTGFGPDSVLEYGYCTEFVLQLMNAKTNISEFVLDSFVGPLEEMGDSIVAVCNGDNVKIHIHTFTPEKVLEYGRRFGEFVTLKIENMSVQHSENTAAPKREHVKYAIIAVASGQGIIDYFYDIGANYVIDGGQTNNPSVDDFVTAFRSFDAEHIIVLPNNSNIILTAKQAAEVYTETDVRVLTTKSIVEGCSALSMMDEWCDDVDELIGNMSSGLDNVTSGYLTTAVRDSHLNGLDIKKGNYIGLDDDTILACGENKVDTATKLIKNIFEQSEKEVIIVFYGADASEEDTDNLREILEKEYPLADIGFIDGKQEIYDFIISLE